MDAAKPVAARHGSLQATAATGVKPWHRSGPAGLLPRRGNGKVLQPCLVFSEGWMSLALLVCPALVVGTQVAPEGVFWYICVYVYILCVVLRGMLLFGGCGQLSWLGDALWWRACGRGALQAWGQSHVAPLWVSSVLGLAQADFVEFVAVLCLPLPLLLGFTL